MKTKKHRNATLDRVVQAAQPNVLPRAKAIAELRAVHFTPTLDAAAILAAFLQKLLVLVAEAARSLRHQIAALLAGSTKAIRQHVPE